MKQMKFGKLLVVWFAHGIMVFLGILLWICQVYSEALKQWYESQVCRRIIWAPATAEILLFLHQNELLNME